LVLLVALVSGAQAHNPSSDMALEPFVHDGHVGGAWTTAGLVREDAFAWLEVCGAALPGLTDATLTADGRFLRAGGDLLEESTDGGCSFEPRPDVPLARGLTWLGDTLVATTSDPSVGVYVSIDDGVSFAPAAPFPRALTATGITLDGSGAWWVTAEGSPDGVLTSPDAGATWEEVPLPPTTGIVVFVPQGPGPHGGVIVTAATFRSLTEVWESMAGGGWDLLATLPLSANAVACLGTVCLATLSEFALVRWDAAIGPSSLTLVNDGPVGCLYAADDGSVWGCNARGSVALFARTTDGLVFEQLLAGEVITLRSCPDDTPGALLCPLPPAPPVDTGPPVDPGPPPGTDDTVDVQGGCCATAGTGPRPLAATSALSLAFLVGWKLRRTRPSLAR
jgi:hypothetical protein